MLSLPVVRDFVYRPRNYRHRKVAVKAPREFILFLEKLTHKDVNWILPWWSIDTFIMRTYPSRCVVIVGLSKASYFCLGSLNRQWGEFRTVLGEFCLDFSGGISQKMMDKIASTWRSVSYKRGKKGPKRPIPAAYMNLGSYVISSSERDNKVRALRLAAKLGKSEENRIDTQGMKRKAF